MQLTRRILLLLFTVLPVLVAVSCADDGSAADPDAGTAGDDGRSCYFVFRLDTEGAAAQSRATWDDAQSDRAADGDLVHGTEAEHRIGYSGNYALFFDAGGVLRAVTGLSLLMNGHDVDPDADDKVEARYTTVLKSTERNFPQAGWRVLVVLNGQRVYTELTSRHAVGSATEQEVLEAVWSESDPTRIGRNDAGLFVMTNAVCVRDGGVYASVELVPQMIHMLEDDHDPMPDPDLTDAEILTVHVERMVSKFTLELEGTLAGGENIYQPEQHPSEEDEVNEFVSQNHQINLCLGWTRNDSYDDEDGNHPFVSNDWAPTVEARNWRAQVVGWGMNALERQSPLFRRLDASANYFGDWRWNDPTYYRSYWAEDLHYDQTVYYPWQYRRAVDRVLNYYGNTGNNMLASSEQWENVLLNYPWNGALLNYQPGQVIYTPENTYDPSYPNLALDGRRELLAGTHLIVRAKLLVADGQGGYTTPAHLYRDRAGVWYTSAKDCVWGLVRAFNYALASQTRMEYRWYDWRASTDTPTIYYGVPTITYLDEGASEETDRFKLYYNGTEMTYESVMALGDATCEALLAEAFIKDGDSKRLLKADGFSIRRRDAATGRMIDLPIYEIYEVGVDEDGKGGFEPRPKVPRAAAIDTNDIQSLLFEWVGAVDYFVDGMMYYAAPAQIVTEKIYGAVRNAWYMFRVSAINNIGVPVHDASMPIVPNWSEPFDQINVRVTILDWHEVTGDVPLLPGELPDSEEIQPAS